MPPFFRLALAQINPTVGALDSNLSRLLENAQEAARLKADLVLTPELSLTGYPTEDLTRRPAFLEQIRRAVEKLAQATAQGPALLVGAPWLEGDRLFNAALLLENGTIAGRAFKQALPNEGPFDEKRVFDPAPPGSPLLWRGARLGVLICEDMWTPEAARHLAAQGSDALLAMNASPWEPAKPARRLELARARVRETGLPLAYVNQVGGQDELVFDGASFVLDAQGALCARLPVWREALACGHWTDGGAAPDVIAPQPEGEAATYGGLVLGLRDYVRKNGFRDAFLGLSGGVDSALVAALAVDALGAAHVRGVMMTSPFTSRESLEDAADVARRLGIRLDTLSIEPAMALFDRTLAPFLDPHAPDVMEENLQARIRGVLLMALSNREGGLVLATGNKSEMAAGYATLYGDMCGGFAPLKDVYKTEVYRLARWRNAGKPEGASGPDGAVFSDRALTKEPTAELRPNQKDSDSLPPYAILDAILENLVERDASVAETVARGFDAATVRRVWTLLTRAEYKRRQSPPGPRVTSRHLGRDRRYPITNGYAEEG